MAKERTEQSMIEIATDLLKEEKKAMHYRDLFDQVAKIKQLTKKQQDGVIAQFYTDLNLDGRFLTLGQGLWGLKVWYPVEQIDEEITQEPKKKKKKKKKVKEKVIEPSIDDVDDEDLTEIPLGFITKDLKDEDDEEEDDDDDDVVVELGSEDDDLYDDDDDDEDEDDLDDDEEDDEDEVKKD